jgi:hypothetical protein
METDMRNTQEGCKMIRFKFMQKFRSISDEDLYCNDGNSMEQMLNRLQQKLGMTREELYRIILAL